MSVDSPVRPRTASTSRSTSAFKGSPQFPTEQLHPCTATAAYFLFSQGTTIVVLHHDTLAVERRFEGHQSQIAFVAADNVSERGAGRLVVSYDTSQTAIVWDLFTGNEISRFASFDLIRVGNWMRNGNVAFGNGKGEVIIFEPSTSEHVSTRTTFDAITALAPAADCQRHAIGYANGSILIATLQPNFTILHSLSTSKGPSPIVSLAWHASSAKQKSDMLATQTVNGDLFLWSVSKQSGDAPRVIRALKKPESSYLSPKWLAWSKNGRLIQYTDGETWSWDVRTKHVTYDCVPTVKDLVGIANYGPSATLFTVGPDHTIQQYDLSSGLITAHVQHLPGNAALPPSPAPKTAQPAHQASLTLQNLGQRFMDSRVPSTPTDYSPRFERVMSPASTRSLTGSASSGGYSRRPTYRHKSQIAKSLYSGTGTSFSTSSNVHTLGNTSLYTGSSMKYGPINPSMGPRSRPGSRPGSRLRQEVLPSLEEEQEEDFVDDLFPYIRSRLNELPFSTPPRVDEANSSSDELRKQMLHVVFGWEGDIEGLIRDELCRHAVGSPRAILLARWLAHLDRGLMLAMAGSANSSYLDWMLLALSQLGSQSASKKIGLAFVQQLLASGDIHASVAVLIGLGDSNDAVEVYVSRKLYMEAILLASLLMPSEWTRLSYLVRKWGEHVVQNSQQHLAIRCFACTDAAPPERWDSPSVHMTNILSDQLASQPKLSSPAPSANNQPGMLSSPTAAKRQSLKLITQFSQPLEPQFRFPGLASADMTPINMPGITPIESALDPMMSPGYRSNTPRSIAQSLSKASTPASFARHRLPSIGETPTDVQLPMFQAPKSLAPSRDSSSDNEKKKMERDEKSSQASLADSPELLPAARYTPAETPTTALPGRDTSSLTSRRRNSSQDQKVMDLGIHNAGSEQAQPSGPLFRNPFSPDRKVSSPPPLTSDKEQDVARSKTASPQWPYKQPGVARSMGGRSIDDCINGHDEGKYYFEPPTSSRRDDERGRTGQRSTEPAKRSPTAVPVSQGSQINGSNNLPGSPGKVRQAKSRSRSKPRSTSRKSRQSRVRGERGWSKPSSRATSTDRARLTHVNGNERKTPSGYNIQSPTSPPPMVWSDNEQDPNFEEKLRYVTEDRKQRMRYSMRRERGTGTGRDASRAWARQDSEQSTPTAVIPATPKTGASFRTAPRPAHRHSQSMDAERLGMSKSLNQSTGNINLSRKELAAAELEARRLSLARRPSAPTIPHPGEIELYSARMKNQGDGVASPPASGNSPILTFSAKKLTPGSAQSQFETVRVPCTVPVGLPSTPRAMKHPKYSVGYAEEVPAMPNIPSTLAGKGNNTGMNSESLMTPHAALQRAMSAPIPDDVDGLPAHPHYNRALPGSKVQNGSAPSRRGSTTPMQRHQYQYQQQPPSPPGNGSSGSNQVSPPVLPQLQHLGDHPPPPPPPPPPPAPENLPNDQRLSLSSVAGSGVSVGTINIAIDNGPESGVGVVPGPHGSYGILNVPQRPATTNSFRPDAIHDRNSRYMNGYVNGAGYNPSYNPIERSTSAQGTSHEFYSSHGRTRSITDNLNLQSRIRHMADRMRNSSRPGNGRMSISRPMSPPEIWRQTGSVDLSKGELPYESVKVMSDKV